MNGPQRGIRPLALLPSNSSQDKTLGTMREGGKATPQLAQSASPRPTETAISSGKRPERAGEVGEETDLCLSGLVIAFPTEVSIHISSRSGKVRK